MSPTVSVITAAYNAESTIKDSMRSVLNQDYDNIELIVVLNGCTDSTESLVKEISNVDKRVKIVTSSKGKVPARNKGFMTARGSVIAINDSDDVWLPGKLSAQMNSIESGFDVVGGRIECINDYGVVTQDPIDRPISHSEIVRSLVSGVNPLANSATIFKREVIENVGIYDDCFPFCEDYHFWLRAIKFARFENIDEVVMRYYSHSSPDYDHQIPIALASFYKSVYEYTGVIKR
jgi:glycosyltransferase involved in cell wall biosynthesis